MKRIKQICEICKIEIHEDEKDFLGFDIHDRCVLNEENQSQEEKTYLFPYKELDFD